MGGRALLALTADDHIVLVHDCDAYDGKAPDRATFVADSTLTRLDFGQFIDWVQHTCSDCRIVTGTKFEFGHCGKLTQPQILTLYLLEIAAEADLAALANVPSLVAVTMPLDRVPFQSSDVQIGTGKPVFSHGYPWMMRSEIVPCLARAFGVTGFY